MTNKQLLKRLQYYQNKMLNIKDYSFYLASSTNKDIGIYFNIWIHDINKDHEIVFNNNFNIKDSLLAFKLIELRDFIDGLLNKEKTRN